MGDSCYGPCRLCGREGWKPGGMIKGSGCNCPPVRKENELHVLTDPVYAWVIVDEEPERFIDDQDFDEVHDIFC